MTTLRQLTPALLLALAASCSSGSGGGGPVTTPPPAFSVGGPIDGLTPAELAAFERGKVIFEKEFKPSEGMGPFYNATSCRSCHSSPVSGGSAALYRNFYLARIGPGGVQFNFPSLPSPVVPAFGTGNHIVADFTLTGGRPVIPEMMFGTEVVVAQRNAIPIFGTGLFEFVSDQTIMDMSDPEDADGDGISGRFNTDSGSIGRFGVKAQSNNVELFTRAPLQNQMGITSDPFLGSGSVVSLAHAPALQATTDPNLPTSDADLIPDPEISTQDLGDLIAFTRFLAPPQKLDFSLAAARGEVLFDQIGCAKCHVPSIPSSRGPVEAYTDLLLHDMGPDLADGLNFGIPQFSTTDPLLTGSEWRTQPLWGVRMHAPYLHDGRAETLDEAIQLHGGEAAAIRDEYANLPQTDRDDILEFLEAL